MKQSQLVHEFVDIIPEDPDAGRLYISIRFRTATHLCACGCGTKVVTPIKPARWRLIYNGETVSLVPSIGRWQLECRSHYWIHQDRVVWSRSFSEKEVASVLAKDAANLHDYYATRRSLGMSAVSASESGSSPESPSAASEGDGA